MRWAHVFSHSHLVGLLRQLPVVVVVVAWPWDVASYWLVWLSLPDGHLYEHLPDDAFLSTLTFDAYCLFCPFPCLFPFPCPCLCLCPYLCPCFCFCPYPCLCLCPVACPCPFPSGPFPCPVPLQVTVNVILSSDVAVRIACRLGCCLVAWLSWRLVEMACDGDLWEKEQNQKSEIDMEMPWELSNPITSNDSIKCVA